MGGYPGRAVNSRAMADAEPIRTMAGRVRGNSAAGRRPPASAVRTPLPTPSGTPRSPQAYKNLQQRPDPPLEASDSITGTVVGPTAVVILRIRS